jgi:hypothetical protein
MADALVPPIGAELIATMGVDVYPYPSLFKNISLTYPVLIIAAAIATDPELIS